jgi:predicted permease
MDTLVQDLRFALRTLIHSPGFAFLAIGCLAIGIGVNSVMFSVVDTVAIRPLPFSDPAHLVALHTTNTARAINFGAVSYLDLQDWKERTRSFDAVVAVSSRSLTVSDAGGEPEFADAAAVTWDLFPTLGIKPILGRQFRPEEDRPGAAPVVLLSHPLWQRRYASDPSTVGRTISVNGQSHTVIGVMPPRFQFPERELLWIPLTPAEHTSPRTSHRLDVFARLKAGASLAAARQDVAAVAEQLANEHADDRGWGATARTMRDALSDSEVTLIVVTMMGAVTLVLAIACANVANLLLARATVRRREIAVRGALGAGRGRIVRQLLTESILIGVASAPLGVLIAYVGLEWLTSAIPPQNQAPYYLDWSLNLRVVEYAATVAVLTGVIFGLAPAFDAAKSDLHDSLKDGGRAGGGARRNHLRSTLVVAEIALSLVLLVGASLFIRSFVNLQRSRAGLDSSSWMLVRFNMTGPQYDAPDAQVRRVREIVQRVETLPGVASATASNMLPYHGGGSGGPAVPEGVALSADQEPNVLSFGVTAHWLRTLGVPIVAGRDFADTELATRSNVAVVNQVLARRLWPKLADVVGQRFRFKRDRPDDWITVVGVVNDFRLFTVRDGTPSPYAFVSYPRDPARTTGLTIRVAGGAPSSIMSAVRAEIRKSDSRIPIFVAETGDDARTNTFWEYRLFGWMFSIFGGVALALASVGVYGVLAYSVSQRTQEIGVRMALGASREDVFRLVVGDGARLAGAGILCGIVGALGANQAVKSLLYNVSTTDPISFVGTAAFLAAIALVASYVPARRATAVDPMTALRAE